MSQSTQGHTLIISIQLDDSAEDIYYGIDQLTLATGQIPGNGDPAAQIHFNCLDCQTRYFISPQIVKLVELDTVSKVKVSEVKPVDVKKASEPVWLESGSSDEVLTDDEVLEVEKKVPVAIGNNKEKQDSKIVVKNDGQNNRHRQKKEISEVKKKGYLAMHKKQFHQNEFRIREDCRQRKICTKDSCGLACGAFSPQKTNIKKKKESKAVVNDKCIQKQYLELHPFIRLTRIDNEEKNFGQNNRQRQKKEISKVKKKHYYKCDICGSSIKLRSDLIRHMKLHFGIRYSCSDCPKSFRQKTHLNCHKKNLHQSEFRICEVCGGSKTCTKAEYNSHLLRRHPKFHIKRFLQVQNFNGVDFPCFYCEPQAIFKNFEELKEHFKVTHDRKFSCSRCPKAFGDKSNLKHHIDSVHDKKTKCGKAFARN